MKSKLFWALPLLCLSAVLYGANEIKRAEVKGASGDRIVVFNGGRPWQGEGLSKMIANAGFRAVSLDSRYLDGFGGSTLKVNMRDKVEPAPWDGITPVFKQLFGKKMLMFHDIPQDNLLKILTPERIAILRSYVENGGHLLFTFRTPAQVGDLLPVEIQETVTVDEAAYTATRPELPSFAIFPNPLPVFKHFKRARALEGAEVLSMITLNGQAVSPYIVRKRIGKGYVTFFNGELTYAHQLKELSNWGYGKAFFLTVVAFAAESKCRVEQVIEHMQAIPGRTPLQEVSVQVKPPVLGITEVSSAPAITGRESRFGNGVRVVVDDQGAVAIYYPGIADPVIRNFAIPAISFSTDRSFFDAKTAEATDAAATVSPADIKWALSSVTAEGNQAVLTYTAPGSVMRWLFTAGTLALDGREFTGVAERVEVKKCPLYINTISFKSELTPPEPLFARRNSCYSPPRGYAEFDMSGAADGDTSFWNCFGSGQPFELLVCKNGVYIGHVSEAQALSPRMSRKKGAKAIENVRNVSFGRVHAPVATKNYWHWYSIGEERGHNDYLAIYQFERMDLRRKAGLKEFPAYPICRYSHQLSPKEQETSWKAAVKAGYRYVALPGCEEPADISYDVSRHSKMQTMVRSGAYAHIWTAGSYVQGDGGWIYNTHPEWFVRDKKGQIFAYGNGRYPVIDVNNEAYLQWFMELARPAIERGVRWVYRDMDGAAAGCINYAKTESPHGMASQIRVYRFFHENNCRVAIEGMNPLALDEYWYRPALYTPFAGNEFCLVGSVPAANFYEGLELDFFRTGMYGCFPITELTGYAYQFDRVAEEVTRANRMVSFVPKFNEALDNTGMPFIRETPFGTTWIGEKGGALFFWNPVKKATVVLPDGWRIKGVSGTVLTDVKADAIYLLEKQP